jgi:hypothetical protein
MMMLQVAGVERRHGYSLPQTSPISTSWNDQDVNPAFKFVDVTGAHEGGSGAFAIFDFALASLLQNTYYGTGGELLLVEATMQTLASASGAYIVVQNSPQSTLPIDLSETTLTEVGKQLAFARHYFSLNTTDLSRILLVERPTIYAWLDDKWEPNQENRGRIRKLYQLALAWREISNQPVGRFLREPVDGEFSLMDHLVREPLEMAVINRILNIIHDQADRKTRAKRARSVRAIAKQSGFKPLSPVLESERFDQITRF